MDITRYVLSCAAIFVAGAASDGGNAAVAQTLPAQSNAFTSNFAAADFGAAFPSGVIWAPVNPDAVKARARAITYQAKREASRGSANSIFVSNDARGYPDGDLNIGSVVATNGGSINARFITITSPAASGNITVVGKQ